MTYEEFKGLLGVHGSDLGKWPHDRRAEAMRLLRDSAAAQQAYEEACALDSVLRSDAGRLNADRRAALIDGIMDAIDTEAEPEPGRPRLFGGAPDDDSPPRDGNPADVLPTVKTADAAPPLRSADGFVGIALPRPSVLAVCVVLGIVLGLAVAQSTQLSHAILPEHGGIELWMR